MEICYKAFFTYHLIYTVLYYVQNSGQILVDWFIAKLNENTEISDFNKNEIWDNIGSPFSVYEKEC